MPRRPFAVLTAVAIAAVAAAGCAHDSGQTAASAASPQATFGDSSRGAEVFRANCAVCHTAGGAAAGVGPSLVHEKLRKNYKQTIAAIEQPEPLMPKLFPAPLSEKDVDDVATYVQSL